jgi:hypothetical protein
MSLHNQKKRWSDSDIYNLMTLAKQGLNWDAIGIHLGRTVVACKAKLSELRNKACKKAYEETNKDFTPMEVDEEDAFWNRIEDLTGYNPDEYIRRDYAQLGK